MKEGIHPDYRESFSPTCKRAASSSPVRRCKPGTIELDGKTYPLFKCDVTSESHPFYTGAQTRIVETGRVESSAPAARPTRSSSAT